MIPKEIMGLFERVFQFKNIFNLDLETQAKIQLKIIDSQRKIKKIEKKLIESQLCEHIYQFKNVFNLDLETSAKKQLGILDLQRKTSEIEKKLIESKLAEADIKIAEISAKSIEKDIVIKDAQFKLKEAYSQIHSLKIDLEKMKFSNSQSGSMFLSSSIFSSGKTYCSFLFPFK